MEVLHTIIYIVELILFIYLGFAALYVFVFALASIFPHKQKVPTNTTKRKFAVLIPGYKEDAVIVHVAKDALLQDYPNDAYDVVVIADSFQANTLMALRELPITLVEVSFDISTKSKALNKAMQSIGSQYDVALVLDADNLMAADFITKVNQAFDNGFNVVQGHRTAKNLNTSFAILDAISEEVNNNIFRKGHRVLGFSSALIGSGMAFDYAFFKNTMSKVNAIGGFDKELELKLLKNRKKIEYLNDAIVLDEKVQKSEVFAKQRKRWLSAQFVYFARYFFPGLYHLFFKGNIDFFDKVYQMISPPRILLLGLTSIITAVYAALWLYSGVTPFSFTFMHWLPIFLFVVFAFLFSIPFKFYNKNTLVAIVTLPRAFFLMFASLFKLKGANKKFIHTEHGVNN
ncbi:MAG: glycosyltransferase family 2 protein [Marinifilum sp.]|jgi:cellulose synthase/poly-beta-1,6-N-acetylglucosamine synthase-like glycosyltransferase|nr:glycosyltransferase family 2 protein [Marinifilum sp.]